MNHFQISVLISQYLITGKVITKITFSENYLCLVPVINTLLLILKIQK